MTISTTALALATTNDWFYDIDAAARLVHVPAEFAPAEPELPPSPTVFARTKHVRSSAICPMCGWFVHYAGSPQHNACREQLNRQWDGLQYDECPFVSDEEPDKTELRAWVVRLVQSTCSSDTSPYELLWRHMMD